MSSQFHAASPRNALMTLGTTLTLVWASCTSTYEFTLPDEHPAHAAEPAGPLPVPSPYDVEPPFDDSTNDRSVRRPTETDIDAETMSDTMHGHHGS